MPVYETLVTALTGLKARGYTLDFNIAFDSIDCTEHGICLNPSEFEITEVYRFDAETTPGDESVLYVIESKDEKVKGTMVSAFGIYADAASDEMIKKLTMHHKP